MICPACSGVLSALSTEGFAVDVCRAGCGGIWFDNFELKRVDEISERAGEVLLAFEPRPAVSVDANRRRRCPRCPDLIMMRHFHNDRKKVEVDTCPGCGGVWLDAGELALIRQEGSTSRDDRRQQAQAYFQKVFRQDFVRLRPGAR